MLVTQHEVLDAIRKGARSEADPEVAAMVDALDALGISVDMTKAIPPGAAVD